MEAFIWIGAFVTLCGLALLVWCILKIMRARKAGLAEDALREALQRIVPLNTGALFLSMTGLILVVIGIILS